MLLQVSGRLEALLAQVALEGSIVQEAASLGAEWAEQFTLLGSSGGVSSLAAPALGAWALVATLSQSYPLDLNAGFGSLDSVIRRMFKCRFADLCFQVRVPGWFTTIIGPVGRLLVLR